MNGSRLRMLAGALVLAASLAGCADPGSSGGADGPTQSPTGTGSSSPTGGPGQPQVGPTLDLLLDFSFDSCQGVAVQHSRPLEDVQALLPDGFTAAPAPGSGSPSFGVLAIDLFACGNLTTGAVAIPSVFVGQTYTFIERPVDVLPDAPDAARQEYVLRMLAGQDLLATLWPAAGYDTYAGNASIAVFQDTGPLKPGSASVEPGYFVVTAGAPAPVLSGPRSDAFARYTALDDGSILVWTGTYDFPAGAAGAAYVEVAPDDPFAVHGTGLPNRPALAATSQYHEGAFQRDLDLRRVFV